MKKKLLFRIGTLQAGGAERMLVDIINNLDANLYDITLLLNVNYGVFLKELRKDITYTYLYEEVELPFISSYIPIISKIIRKLKHVIYFTFPFLIETFILKNKEFDTTICFLQDMADSVYKIKSKNKIIWIHIVLSDYIKENASKKKHLKYIDKYDKIIAISKNVKLDLCELLPDVANKISLHLNPINKALIIQKSQEFYPPEYNLYKNSLKIISVGRVTTQKGFLRLVDLKKKLDKQKINSEFFIVGPSDDKEYLEKLKRKIKQAEVSIHLLGHKENPYPYIKNADIMVHPAIHEGYGLVLAESLLLSTPVVVSNIAVIKEFAKEEVYYIANDDKKFTAEAMEAIKKITNGDVKGNIENTDIVDITEYVQNLKSIL